MKIKLIISSILLIPFSFLGNNFDILARNKYNLISQLGVDYLKKIPANEYILASGDKLFIDFSSSYSELNKEVIIDGEGTIFLERLNRIFVKGLTIKELSNLLNEAYREFIIAPEIEIKVLEYRPIEIYLQGEVTKPGRIILDGSIKIGENLQTSNLNSYFPTVFDAIRKADGITRYADLSNIKIIRKESISKGGGKKFAELDFEQVISQGENSQNIRIYDGDIIQIARSKKPNSGIVKKAIFSNLNPQFIDVFISGRVSQPGKITLSKISTLTDAIAMAGGTKALKGPVRFIRITNDGSIDNRKFSYRNSYKRGGYKNPYLKNGDLIFVGDNLLTTSNEVITEITKPFIGIFSTYGLIKSISD